MRRFLTAGALAGLALAACRGNDSPAGPTPAQADLSAAQTQPARYIVVYKKHVTDTRAEINRHVSAMSSKVERVYQYAIRGWAGTLTSAEVAQLRADPDVALVERDGQVHTMTTQAPTPSWGLDRIDQVSLPLNNSYTYTRTGAGVHFYGIDTGILYAHTDFGGRASAGFDAVTSGGNAVDCNGHGTHTASTAAGTVYGVAKGMTVIGVRVLDCSGSGSVSGVIAGVDWVTQHAIKPAVANMSLGGGLSAALDSTVAASIASGVVYAIASGNGDIFGNPQDACGFSPADVPTAITVNASTITDARASFSNYGPCTDLYAPGVNITAAWLGANNSTTNTISGTSMATPHVAGVVGLYLEANPSATPAQVAAALVANASSNKITNPLANTPNKLLYMGFIPAGSNQPPTASITQPANNASFVQGVSVSFAGSGNDPETGALSGGALTWTSDRDGPIGTGTSFSKTNLSVGTHVITLTATDAQSATGTATRSITITPAVSNQPPTASFTVTCPALQCTFDASSSTDDVGIVTYAWTWGNGRGESHSTPVTKNTFAAPGTYNVTLKVTDGGGLFSSVTKPVQVPTPTGNQPPTASITQPANNASFVQGASVSFAGSGNDPETGALSGGALTWTSDRDGAIGTGTGFSTTTLSVGTHVITLTATDPQNATGTATRTIVITPVVVNQPPVAAFTVSCNTGRPHQCALDASSSTDDVGIVSYAWTWGNGRSETHTVPTVKNTWAAAGTYNVTLTVTDGGGMTASLTKAVVVP